MKTLWSGIKLGLIDWKDVAFTPETVKRFLDLHHAESLKKIKTE